MKKLETSLVLVFVSLTAGHLGAAPNNLGECMTLVNSDRFQIEAKANPESAQRVTNALRNKLVDLSSALETIALSPARENVQAYNEARDDFDHLLKLIDKQQDAGDWVLNEATDKILDLCDDALHSGDAKKN